MGFHRLHRAGGERRQNLLLGARVRRPHWSGKSGLQIGTPYGRQHAVDAALALRVCFPLLMASLATAACRGNCESDA